MITHTTESKDTSSMQQTVENTVGCVFSKDAKMSMRNVKVFYDNKQAINNVSLDLARHQVTALIGPSGCGKSTFLRCLNRMNDTIESCRVEGSFLLDGNDIYHKNGSCSFACSCGYGISKA